MSCFPWHVGTDNDDDDDDYVWLESPVFVPML